MKNHAQEVAEGARFEFGANWARFLRHLNDKRIREAEMTLRDMLGVEDLQGKTFLDIGSGSGLFSLAARRLGAKVHSFDYDPQSKSCTEELKLRYFPDDSDWIIEEGSALDAEYVKSLGHFDIVYSWGVLHHTGKMWTGLENATLPSKPDGQVYIAIYNDQGWVSDYWSLVKRIYIKNSLGRWLMIALHIPYLIGLRVLYRRLTRRVGPDRGMTYWYDMLDWLGGYPFEVATPSEIVQFYEQRGFSLERMNTCGNRHGCNEFVFRNSLRQ